MFLDKLIAVLDTLAARGKQEASATVYIRQGGSGAFHAVKTVRLQQFVSEDKNTVSIYIEC